MITERQLNERIEDLRGEAATLSNLSHPEDGPPPNYVMLRARLAQVEEEIDRLLVLRIRSHP